MKAISSVATPAAFVCAASWLAPSLSAADASASAALPERTAFSAAPLSPLTLTHDDGRRGLRGDFASLNEMLSQISLALPDAQFSMSGVDISITQLVCGELSVEDVRISHDVRSPTSHRVDVGVAGLRTRCSFDVEYKWSFLGGKGSGAATLGPSSSLAVGLAFTSEDFDSQPPHDVSMPGCDADLAIEDMEFYDLGMVGGIVGSMKDSLGDAVEDELGGAVCGELQKLGDDALDDALAALGGRVDAYLEPPRAEIVDPLSTEKDIRFSTVQGGGRLRYLNFRELEQHAGGWASAALDEVDSFLGPSEGVGELGINDLIRDNLLNDEGRLVVDPALLFDSGIIYEGHDMLAQSNVTIRSLQIEGLDTFAEIDLLNAIGNHTLRNRFRLDHLRVIMEVETEMRASSRSGMIAVAPDAAPLRERFTAEFSMTGIDVDASVFLGIESDSLGDLRLGSILHAQNVLPCLVGAIDRAELTGLRVSVSDLAPPELSGFVDGGMEHLISSGTAALFRMYQQALVRAMPNFFETTVREMANDFINDALDAADCPASENTAAGSFVDFRDMLLPSAEAASKGGSGDGRYGNVVPWAMDIIEGRLFAADEDGLSKMNGLVAALTERQSSERGELSYPGDIFKRDLDIALNGLNAAIEIGVSDARISNLDSLGVPIELLRPVGGEPSVLNNTASLGAGRDPLRAELRLLIKGRGDEIEVHNDLVLGLSLESVRMMLEVLAQVGEAQLMAFPLRDASNLQCWLATVVTPVLDKYGLRVGESDSGLMLKKIAVAVAEARLSVDCISCSSPLIAEMAWKLGSQEGVDDTTAVANMILEYLSKLLGGDFVQSALDKISNEAAMKCPHSPSYDQNFAGLKYDELAALEMSEDTYGFLIAIIAVVAAAAATVGLVAVIARCVSRRRHSRWVNTLTRDQQLELESMQKDEKEWEKNLNSRMKSMVRSKEIPLFLRMFIPIVVLGNIALFLSGHLNLGGTVNISGSFAGEHFNVQGFFEFSMLKSTIEMWNAGAKSLAILIAIFSGVWPYTKQLLTLFIWFAPPSWLSSKRRGSILHWLDVLGKWSMVDVFVLLMTLASFRLSVESPDHLKFLPKDLYSINMLVVPLWGLYANMLAQLVSQISSHVIIHYHRKTIKTATHNQEVDAGMAPSNGCKLRERLCSHKFKLDYEASNKHANVRRSVHGILSAALLIFMVLVICGCALPSFSIEVLGLVGLAVESGNQFEQANVSYSVFDLANMIMGQARYLSTASDFIGLGTLSSLLVITVFLVPLAQAAVLATQWFAPMTKKQRMLTAVLNEMLSAWQYMEVYVLSIIISAWQLGGVSEYMINAYCGSMEHMFTTLAYYGILEETDAQCFRVDATVETASWVLVAASLLLFILNHFVSGAASQKVQDHDTPAERRFYTDRWLQSKQSAVTAGGDMSMSSTMDDEEGCLGARDVAISPVKPRFTDYYFFATKHSHE